MKLATYNGARALLTRDFANDPVKLTRAIAYLDERRDSGRGSDSSTIEVAMASTFGADDPFEQAAPTASAPVGGTAATNPRLNGLIEQAMLNGKGITEARALAKATLAATTGEAPNFTYEEYAALPKVQQADLTAQFEHVGNLMEPDGPSLADKLNDPAYFEEALQAQSDRHLRGRIAAAREDAEAIVLAAQQAAMNSRGANAAANLTVEDVLLSKARAAGVSEAERALLTAAAEYRPESPDYGLTLGDKE